MDELEEELESFGYPSPTNSVEMGCKVEGNGGKIKYRASRARTVSEYLEWE